jgi:hypothetical protein
VPVCYSRTAVKLHQLLRDSGKKVTTGLLDGPGFKVGSQQCNGDVQNPDNYKNLLLEGCRFGNDA